MNENPKQINLPKEVCEAIAAAIVDRWTHNVYEHEKIMRIVFEANSAKEAVDQITEKLQEYLGNLSLWGKDRGFDELFHCLFPYIAKTLKEEFEDFKTWEDSPYLHWCEEVNREIPEEGNYLYSKIG